MQSGARRFRRILLLLTIGFCAYLIDDWAKQNANIVFAIFELILLAIWVGVDLKEVFRGTLEAGPEEPARVKVIEMPLYQVLLAVYGVTIAVVVLFRALNGHTSELLESPFLVWILVAPAVAVGFVLEFRVKRKCKKPNTIVDDRTRHKSDPSNRLTS
jgi:hypothetical protein